MDDHSKHVTESKIFSRLTDLIRALSSDSLQSVSSMFYSAWVSLHCFVVRLFLEQSGLTFLQPLTKHLVDSGDLSILSEPGVFHDMLPRPSFGDSYSKTSIVFLSLLLMIDSNRLLFSHIVSTHSSNNLSLVAT